MARQEFKKIVPFAYIEEDAGAPQGHKYPETVEKGAGVLVLGFEIDGVQKVIFAGKAGGFLDDVARAEQAKSSAGSKSSK